MERVTETENTIEVFENDIDLYLHQFCEDNDIDDLKRESQSVWNSCLRYIYTNVFKHNNHVLKSHNNININNNDIPSNYNMYNYELLNELVDYYIYNMCFKYDKEVSILGFTSLTGIDESIVYDWGNNVNKLSSESSKIYKKLNQFREESLSNKLATGNKNPVGILAILNRHYQWNMPGVSREQANKSALTAAELPQLGTPQTPQIQGIVDNGGDNTV